MKQSIRFRIEMSIKAIEEKIAPDVNKLNHLRNALSTIDNLPPYVPHVDAKKHKAGDAVQIKRCTKKRYLRANYGDRPAVDLVLDSFDAFPFKTFRVNDIHREIKKRFNINMNRKTIGVAMSSLCKAGKVIRKSKGVYFNPSTKI